MPGSSRPCGLGKRARSVTVPVFWSTMASENSTCPASRSRCRPRASGATGAAGRRHAAAGQRSAQRDEVGARLLDVDIDRVQPLDHRQRIGLAVGDQRADGGQRTADPPADRRGHAREPQVDLRRFERGLVLRDGGGGLLRGRPRRRCSPAWRPPPCPPADDSGSALRLARPRAPPARSPGWPAPGPRPRDRGWDRSRRAVWPALDDAPSGNAGALITPETCGRTSEVS